MFVYIVYKITNIINNKIYIGFHKCKNLDDGYMGSGKLIKRAINFYGKENFEKEVLYIFKFKHDAENFERSLVNKEFVERVDTYNVSLGGNVTILYGEHNGFYNKKHTKESINKIQLNRSKTILNRNYVQKNKYHANINGDIVFNRVQLLNKLKCKSIKKALKIIFNSENMYFINKEDHLSFEILYESIIKKEIETKERIKEEASKRFKGVPKSKETKEKIKNSHIGKKHSWQNKINKNQDKIRKTAEAHKGMKRTDKTKENISTALKDMYKNGFISKTKNTVWAYDPLTLEAKMFKQNDIPDGWLLGNPNNRKKCYYNPKTLECKRFKDNQQPNGWILGNPNARKPKKNY